MKTIVVLAALVAAAVALPADTYDSQYDNYDVDELLSNDRLRKNLLHCLLNGKPCTPEGTKFSKILPEALRTQCGKCTPKQRQLVRTAIHGFQEKDSELWNKLVNKVDPKGEFTVSFNEFLNASD